MSTSKQTVLLLGATGHTGKSILRGLLKDKSAFNVEVLVRPSSAEKSDVKQLKNSLGLKIRIVDIVEAPVEDLVQVLNGIDVFISAIDMMSQLSQLRLVTAAKQAGVKRFVPCAFITVCPPGGVMPMRDTKEQVYQEIWKAHLPYTIIDVGFWHQLSFPTLPSGKIDYGSIMPKNRLPIRDIHDGGNAPNMLTDVRDIGNYVALIIKDPRTLNKFVCTYSDVLSENEIFAMLEEMSRENIERKHVSAADILAMRDTASAILATDPTNVQALMMLHQAGYDNNKYVRGDNTPAYAKYLGYLDARELYPEFQPITFREYLVELLDGRAEKP
ncbi:glycoside hydrolase [Favolaschia claudopus]|uniref:Glycoside hydrolase n=1 Tax=Favolaschia claudopus TaxID=2862362 RepID=A0AAV9Z641_9AGAR